MLQLPSSLESVGILVDTIYNKPRNEISHIYRSLNFIYLFSAPLKQLLHSFDQLDNPSSVYNKKEDVSKLVIRFYYFIYAEK